MLKQANENFGKILFSQIRVSFRFGEVLPKYYDETKRNLSKYVIYFKGW
jgi:hypothetical protein